MSIATDLRKKIADDPNITFNFWVRRWRDGMISVGAEYYRAERTQKLYNRLVELGYTPSLTCKQGTAGEGIIDLVSEQ